MGKPTKRTSQNAERICALLAEGHTRATSYTATGVSKPTFCEWIRDDEGFRTRVEAAEESAIASLVEEVRAASRDSGGKRGDWKAAAWLLERRRPAEFGRRQRIEISTTTVDEFAEALVAMVDAGRMTQEQAEGAIHEFEKRHAGDASA